MKKASSLCEKKWSLEEKQRTFVRNQRTLRESPQPRAKGSALDLQTVVGIGHAFGQLSVGFALSTGLVTHVDEIGARCSDASCHGDGLFERLVRVVRFGTQSAHHQRAHALQFRPFAVGKGRKVGHIGQIADAKPRNRETSVHHTDGRDGGAGRCERLVDGKLVHCELRRTGVVVFPKAIAHVPENGGGYVGFGPHLDRTEVGERAEVVESRHVVEMFVGEEHRIERGHGVRATGRFVESGSAGLLITHFGHTTLVVGEGTGAEGVLGDETQHLRAKIGAAVDEQEAMVVGLKQCRTARAAIARIGRGAHGASASHLWDARGGAGAEKVKFHV